MSKKERLPPTIIMPERHILTQEAFTRLHVCGVWKASHAGIVVALVGNRTYHHDTCR